MPHIYYDIHLSGSMDKKITLRDGFFTNNKNISLNDTDVFHREYMYNNEEFIKDSDGFITWEYLESRSYDNVLWESGKLTTVGSQDIDIKKEDGNIVGISHDLTRQLNYITSVQRLTQNMRCFQEVKDKLNKMVNEFLDDIEKDLNDEQDTYGADNVPINMEKYSVIINLYRKMFE